MGTCEGERMDEHALVGRAQAGNAAALTQLFAAYYGPITSYLYQLVLDREVAGDLAQDTFLRAYRALDHADPALPFRPWLYRIATNVAHNYHRRRRLLRWLPLDIIAHRASSGAPIAEQFGEHEHVVSALQCIGPTYASAILLHHHQGLSLAETAAVLGLTPNATKVRLFRARKAFAQAYIALSGRQEES